MVLVIRYYGGTKLGVGPLGKAYYQAAHNVLVSADIKTKNFFSLIRISFAYNFTSQVHHIIKQFSAINIRNKFEGNPIIECNVKVDKIPFLINELKQHSSGTVKIKILKKSKLITVSSKTVKS